MREPEDLLREALQDDAPIGPGSFDDVRDRAHRLDRRARALRVGAVVAVVVACVGVAIPLLGRGDGDKRVITNPSPDRTTVPPVSSDEPVGIWPFSSAAAADRSDGPLPFDPTHPEEVAFAFLQTVGGMDAVTMHTTRHADGSVSVDAAPDQGPRTTSVTLRQLGASHRWTIIDVRADGLVLAAQGAVLTSSPAHVSGAATAFEGTVVVKVVDRTLDARKLGEGVVTGEMGVMKPFVGDVPFQLDATGLGAIVAVTHSAKDGAVEQVAAVPIRWNSNGSSR